MRFRLWPGMVFGLIGLNATVVIATAWLAGHDRSFAVEPDYDGKAARWDLAAAQRSANQSLGWSIGLDIDPVIDGHDAKMTIEARVADSRGDALSPSQIQVDAFPSVRASARQRVILTSASDGAFHGSLRLTAPGIWLFDVTVKSGPDVFTDRIERVVVGPVMAEAQGGVR